MLSAYTSTSDSGLFAAALLELFGVVLEGLACFGVYRLMAAKSPKYAHRYRSGIFGYLMFCACGFHVPVCAAVFLMKHGLSEALLTQYSAPPDAAARAVLDLLLCAGDDADRRIPKGADTVSEVVLRLLYGVRHATTRSAATRTLIAESIPSTATSRATAGTNRNQRGENKNGTRKPSAFAFRFCAY